MTPTKEQIEHALSFFDQEPMNVVGNRLAAAYRASRAEVEELRGLINEVLPVGDIADGLAPYYIESGTIHRMRKALEGKE